MMEFEQLGVYEPIAIEHPAESGNLIFIIVSGHTRRIPHS